MSKAKWKWGNANNDEDNDDDVVGTSAKHMRRASERTRATTKREVLKAKWKRKYKDPRVLN